jgi:DNA-binding beta-propeller fold protein YncE
MPDVSQLEDRLRAAYSDVAATVRPEDISEHAPAATSPVRWRAVTRTGRRRGAALATAAAVLLIVISATVIPHALQSGSRHRSRGPAAARQLPPSHTAYVVSSSAGSGIVPGQLIPVNLATGRTLTPIPLGAKGYLGEIAISPDGTMAYVLDMRGQLVPVDVRTGKVGKPINFGGRPLQFVTTPDGKKAYVLEPPYGVAAVDLATRTALGFIKVHYAESFALTPNGKTLYVLGAATETTGAFLTAIDTATNMTIATIELHGPEIREVSYLGSLTMAPDGETVYVALALDPRGNVHSFRSTDEIIPVDVASNTERTPIVSGAVSGVLWHGLTISPDSQTGYLNQTQSLIPVNLRTGALSAPIPLPSALQAGYDLTFSPDGQLLYVIQRRVNPTVIPIDTATGRAMQPIELGAPGWQASEGVFAPGSKTLYILSYDLDYRNLVYLGSRITPIDAATGAVGKPISFPAGPDNIVFSP